MGHLQILVAAASMAFTYGGLVGADTLLTRFGAGVDVEQTGAPANEIVEEEER